MVWGVVIGGVVVMVVEVVIEGIKIVDLYVCDNWMGVEVVLLDFGVCSVGGWIGVVVGVKVGMLLGIEFGFGVIVIGIIGGGLGVWGGSEIVDWIEKY